jgi:hypothetical protein
MKCAIHNTDATAICPHCGRAMCPACGGIGTAQRAACSEACAAALAKADQALDLILRKSTQLARTSALMCYLFGGIFLASAPLTFWMLPYLRATPILGLVLGSGLLLAGVWYDRAAKQKR